VASRRVLEEVRIWLSLDLQRGWYRTDRGQHQRGTPAPAAASAQDPAGLLVATMLDVRSANLMDLAAGLPLGADRTDRLCQISGQLAESATSG
jgi:hypothetical protein